MGGSSDHGCQACNFEGVWFGETMKYPYYSRYTSLNDPRRLRRPTGVPNHSKMYNLCTETNPTPKKRTNDTYIKEATRVENGETTAASV
jgi:hypothetical protein